MEQLNKDFTPYKQSLEIKELGFDEPCFGYYENNVFILQHNSKQEYELLLNCSAPTFSQAFRWFREKYKINSQIAFCEYSIKSENSWKFTFDNPTGRQYWEGKFKTYEETELACLKKLIEIVKNGK